MVTSRNPFEHTKGDDLVVRKVLNGDRPDRPPVGFSDALWALLTQSWVEVPESSDPQSARPSIANVLERLQDEEKSWSSAGERPLPPVPVEREASRMSLIAPRPTHTWLTWSSVTSTSSVGVSGFLERLAKNTGLFLRRRLRADVFSPRSPGDDSHEADFDNTLNIGHTVSSETTNDGWSFLGAKPLAILSSRPPPDATSEGPVGDPLICNNYNRILVPDLPPAPNDWFSQITNEILDLTDQVASVALFGSIGVGKSFLARSVLNDDRTKVKFGKNRHFLSCDGPVNSLDGFIKGLSDTIHTDIEQLQSRLQSSPPLIFLLDSVDSALDPLTPEAEEIYARIEEFGGYEHVCLVTTSRMYPSIHGFHRVEVPTPTADGARDIFYSLCDLDRSPAVDALVMSLGSHPFSIELLARSTRENNWDEQMLLKAWGDQKGVLRTSYYQGLKDMIEPVFLSPRIRELGTMARDVLEAVASFQSGIREHQLEGIFHRIGGVRDVVDVLCRFSLVCRRDGVLRMLSPLQFYFLKSMLVYAETEEVIGWGPECMPAKACTSWLDPFHGRRVTNF